MGVVHYVGRTGDNSSPKATAPYTRMGQHLGYNENQNALRKHLKKRGIEPDDCERFEFICYGPLFPEVGSPELNRDDRMKLHTPIRNDVGALEKALAEALFNAGYEVLNTVKWRHEHDAAHWPAVRAAFAEHFPKLNATD